jgi:TPR repeat protein
MYLSGELGSVDFVQAFKVLYPLIRKSDNRARVMWSTYKKTTPYPNFVPLIEKQFDKDDQQANYYIAKGYIYGRYGLKINLEKAEEYLLQGASKKDPAKSCYLLATLYGNRDLLFNRKKYAQTLSQLKDCNTYLSTYYMIKLTSESKAAEALEHIRLANDHNFCANHYCARYWLGVIDLQNGTKYKSSPLIADKHFEKALSRKYAPTFCFRAETHLFGYMGIIKVDRAKFYLTEAAKKLNSYKAKVMLTNLPSVLESPYFEAYIKSRKYNDYAQLREILFRYN